MKRSTQAFTDRIIIIAAAFFLIFIVTSTGHAALYTIPNNITSSLHNGFQTPKFGIVQSCVGNCSLDKDAVLVSFTFLSSDSTYSYKNVFLQIQDHPTPLGAGYMAGVDITPISVGFYNPKTWINGAIYSFDVPLAPGNVTNSLLLILDSGTLSGASLQWMFQKSDDAWTGFATSPLVQISNVPIPGAIWLLGSGLIGIVGIRRKLKK